MTPIADIQAVVFGLGDETFALPVGQVREILDHREAFRLPNGPDWLVGLTDVRGEAVPTIDLRRRLGFAPVAATPATRILVVDVAFADRTLTLGLVVDRVLDVARFAGDAIEPSPDIGVHWNSDFIRGVVRTDGGFVVLIDLPRVFDAGIDPALIAGVARAA
jgi:purine-binding chemotaxis protein CheW